MKEEFILGGRDCESDPTIPMEFDMDYAVKKSQLRALHAANCDLQDNLEAVSKKNKELEELEENKKSLERQVNNRMKELENELKEIEEEGKAEEESMKKLIEKSKQEKAQEITERFSKDSLGIDLDL